MLSSRRKAEGLVAKVVPALLTLFIALLTAIPTSLFGKGDMTPAFTLLSIFYWGVYSPGSLPYSFLFILGLLQDSLSGMPLGGSSFINIGVAYLLHSQRKLMGRALFGTVWLTCILLVATAAMTQWSIMCVYSGQTYPFAGAMLRAAVTCIAYPPMHLLLTQVYKRLRNL